MKFEFLIKEIALLAVFMPLIAALAGNAGHQALAVTLRGIVLDEVRPDRIIPLMRRELFVGLIAGGDASLRTSSESKEDDFEGCSKLKFKVK